MRWMAKLVGLGGLVLLFTGCTQQCFITEPDYKQYLKYHPASLEYNPQAGTPPAPHTLQAPQPATVLDPEKRDPWYLSLQEAVAIALEQGTTGIQSVRQPGLIPDDLIS